MGSVGETVPHDDDTGGRGTLRVRHPPGTFALTPASRITVRAVAMARDALRYHGVAARTDRVPFDQDRPALTTRASS